MPEYSQDKRALAIETPLGKDVLLLTSFEGTEEMSRLFEFRLQILSQRNQIPPNEIVGKKISVRINKPDGSPRWFNGFVRRFEYIGTGDRLSMYRAEVVPWLWFLTRTTDCRIFQDKSVLEIVDQVFQDLGFAGDVDPRASSRPKREYTVQYRETDFAFVSRLLEAEGLFYYFEHKQGSHKLVLADKKNAYYDVEDSDVQLLAPMSIKEVTDQLTSWEHSHEFVSGKWAHTDYNFKKPSTDLMTKTDTTVQLPGTTKYELYDYPGDYEVKGDGEKLTRIRMEEEEANYEVVSGTSGCRTFSPGGKFQLKKHFVGAEAGKEYVLVKVNHLSEQGGQYVSTSEDVDYIYKNEFVAIPDSVTFRPARITPQPTVPSILTAIVTGPKGEEIYPDKYGRVRIQFYWDREGKKNENSTCWLRVMQPWTGANWGAIHIPRIGQEVVVSFIGGNPDRPLIMGMLYNDEKMPPYKLPDNKTQTGIKTRSTPKGSSENFNELRFEDEKGEEQIYFHAERDFLRIVENNDKLKVGFDKKEDGDQQIEIFNSQTLKIGTPQSSDGSQTIEIYKDRTTTLKMGNDELTLKMGNQTTKVSLGKIETEALQSIELKVGQNSVKIDQTGITIKGMMVKIEGQMMSQVKGLMTSIEGSAMLTAKGGITMIN